MKAKAFHGEVHYRCRPRAPTGGGEEETSSLFMPLPRLWRRSSEHLCFSLLPKPLYSKARPLAPLTLVSTKPS